LFPFPFGIYFGCVFRSPLSYIFLFSFFFAIDLSTQLPTPPQRKLRAFPLGAFLLFFLFLLFEFHTCAYEFFSHFFFFCIVFFFFLCGCNHSYLAVKRTLSPWFASPSLPFFSFSVCSFQSYRLTEVQHEAQQTKRKRRRKKKKNLTKEKRRRKTELDSSFPTLALLFCLFSFCDSSFPSDFHFSRKAQGGFVLHFF
jgi:hypothetical protein